ncbi:DoxX family protein [Roseomonas xinghualingensis]|uniref:DoxX family protein n=1 Tax=Roseomonas xinghualingensis TaxID=2986475 RepID=UPI0021F10302|nr:DoxX family protein [Roseomonas sp. SXEYE001]MCV4208636.1 DoxX family protein [Roseomonas sp. SXEYE001]
MTGTPRPIAAILDNRAFGVLMRIVITLPYWASGLVKLLDFNGAQAEMAMFNLQPAAPIAIAVIITQLPGAALVIHGRHAWLGAGALAVFTLLTIPFVHSFWAKTGPEAVASMHVAVEHIGMCGGLALAAIQAHWARLRR